MKCCRTEVSKLSVMVQIVNILVFAGHIKPLLYILCVSTYLLVCLGFFFPITFLKCRNHSQLIIEPIDYSLPTPVMEERKTLPNLIPTRLSMILQHSDHMLPNKAIPNSEVQQQLFILLTHLSSVGAATATPQDCELGGSTGTKGYISQWLTQVW